MELNQQGFLLEELLSLRRDDLETLPNFSTEIGEFFSNGWTFDSLHEFEGINNLLATSNTYNNTLPSNSLYQEFTSSPSSLQQQQQQQQQSYYLNEVSCPFIDPPFTDDQFSAAPQFTDSSLDTPPFPVHGDHALVEDDQEMGFLQNHHHQVQNLEMAASASASPSCKVEPSLESPDEPAVFNIGTCPEEKKIKGKKLEGQPSKNLMAERRRRKRLNDRLSMLRSIVPKISKMDRTSILGDTIDYVKELLERINSLQQEIEMGSNQLSILKDTKASEFTVRNSPKFNVERRSDDTQVEICCASKPGLLLSTVTALEALGLEIQQCVISCFNDYAMQASCSEELEQRKLVSSAEDIKQALFRSAGYGGKCL